MKLTLDDRETAECSKIRKKVQFGKVLKAAIDFLLLFSLEWSGPERAWGVKNLKKNHPQF